MSAARDAAGESEASDVPRESEDLDAAEQLLAEALLREGLEREAWLHEACAGDAELERDVLERLSALEWHDLVATSALRTPQQLGDFRLLRRLGGGGMGVVYAAEQLSLGRHVALKIIRPEALLFGDASRALERFRRECRAVAQLAHPGIVPIFAVGEDHGLPYFAMELLGGRTLAHVLADLRGRAPESLSGADLARAVGAPQASGGAAAARVFAGGWVDACVCIVRDAARALQHAHERGLVHRDVKPSNLALEPDGRVRVFDFGLTRSREAERLTQSGAPVGTLHYMAPEQLEGAAIDARCDLYALGVTLHELLALELPFDGDSSLEIQRRILDGTPRDLAQANRKVPADVRAVCSKALARRPADRYASAADLVDDLERALAREPVVARSPGPLARASGWAARRPALSGALAALCVLALASATALYVQQRGHVRDLGAALRRAENEASSATAASELLSWLVGQASPYVQPGEELSVRKALELAEPELDKRLAGEPATVCARVRFDVGGLYLSLGEPARALPHLESALRAFELVDDPRADAARRMSAQISLAMVLTENGDRDRAERLLRGVLDETAAALAAPDDAALDARRQNAARGEMRALSFTAREHLAALMIRRLRLQDARVLLDQALEECGASDAEHADSRVSILSQLATIALMNDDKQRALECSQAAVDTARALRAGPHPLLAEALGARAQVASSASMPVEAERAYREAIELTDTLFGGRGQTCAQLRLGLGVVLYKAGRMAEAEQPFADATQCFSAAIGPNSRFAVEARGSLAAVYFATQRHEQAIELFREVIPEQRRMQGDAGYGTVTSLARIGISLYELGRRAEARPYLIEADAALQQDWAARHENRARVHELVLALAAADGRE